MLISFNMRILMMLVCITLTKAFSVDLTCSDIRNFVNAHNMVRKQVAAQHNTRNKTRPAHMTCLIWDEELARKAEAWALRGTLESNPDITLDSERFEVGENIHVDPDYKEEWLSPRQVVLKWADEKRHYSFKRFAETDSRTNNYTQLIWEKSYFVGCGVSRKIVEFKTVLTVVCYYGPKGNIPGKYPYAASLDGKTSDKLYCGISDCSRKYGDC